MTRIPSERPSGAAGPRIGLRRGIALALLALCAGLPAASAGDGASVAIDRLHAELLDIMKNAEEIGYAGREKRLSEVIPRFFDIDFMARKSLGRQWKRASPNEQQRFRATFERFMVANYAGRFDGYSGQSFETLGEEPARLDTVLVRSVLIDPGNEKVEINYRMRQVDGKWSIIDVYLDGTVSELALRRSEFVSIVKRESFEALLIALDAKIQKLANGEKT